MADLDTLVRAELQARTGDVQTVDLLPGVRARVRRRAVTRRAIAIGSAAACTIVAIAAALLVPASHGARPAGTNGPPSPRSADLLPRDPLAQGVRLGWLPAGWTVVTRTSMADGQELQLSDRRKAGEWPAGAVVQAWYPGAAPIGIGRGTSIRVGAHTAVALSTDERLKNGWRIAWQYAPGGWVAVTVTPGVAMRRPKLDAGAVRDIATRLAAGLAFAVREPLRFPFTLGTAPDGLRPVSAVSAAGFAPQFGYASIAFDDRPGSPGEPALRVVVFTGAVNHGSLRPAGRDRQVGGHRARLFQPRPGWLLVELYEVDGCTVSITANRAQVSRLGGERGLLPLAATVRILPGAAQDPTRWTDRPLS
jgi:hypothetical protein